MEFMATVDLGPMAVRREKFLELGSFHEGFSDEGEPGPGLGIELSARAWLAGCVTFVPQCMCLSCVAYLPRVASVRRSALTSLRTY